MGASIPLLTKLLTLPSLSLQRQVYGALLPANRAKGAPALDPSPTFRSLDCSPTSGHSACQKSVAKPTRVPTAKRTVTI